jgi:hypothetical protein
MKKISYIFYALSMLLVASCDSLLNVNDDPSRISTEEATLPTLLPSAIRFTANSMFGAAQYGVQYPQYLAGQAISQYTPYGFDQLWSPFYSEALPTLQDIIVRAEDAGAYNYSGIAKTLLGLQLMTVADIYGAAPYSEANNGTSNLYPCYDSMQQLYEEHIITLLNGAIEDLQRPLPELPGLRTVQNDFIYNGNLEKWLKAAYAARARYYLHLADKDPSVLSNAIQDAERAFTSNADDLELVYEEQLTNPWFSFIGNATNKIMRPSSYLVDLLAGRGPFAVEDPRLSVYMTKTGTAPADGLIPGVLTGGTDEANVDITATTWHARADAPLHMLTYPEVQFILAEAYFATDKAASYAAYLRGIEASLAEVGVAAADITAFMQSPEIAVGAENLTLSDIMLQKYLALYLQIETWTDMRRYQYDPNVYPGLDKPVVNQMPGNPWIQRSNIADEEPGVNTCLPEVENQDVPLWLFE